MTFGEKLLDLRRRNAMSQDVLAERLDVSRQAVSKWERDEAMPETDKIIRIAQLFGVSTDYLLMDEEPAKEEQTRQESSYQPRQDDTWQPRQRTADSSFFNNTMQRFDRFIRRHGYKGGWFLIGGGTLISAICLAFRAFWRNSVQSMTSGFGSVAGGMQDSYGTIVDEFGNVVDIGGIGSIGGFGDSMFDSFNQAAEQMGNTASSFGDLFLIGLIPGILLIAAGIFVIVKGKKLAQEG